MPHHKSNEAKSIDIFISVWLTTGLFPGMSGRRNGYFYFRRGIGTPPEAGKRCNTIPQRYEIGHFPFSGGLRVLQKKYGTQFSPGALAPFRRLLGTPVRSVLRSAAIGRPSRVVPEHVPPFFWTVLYCRPMRVGCKRWFGNGFPLTSFSLNTAW